jgi:hypothetical protein
MLAGGRMDEGSMMESGDPSNMTAAQRINYLERARQNARRGMVPTQPQFVTIVNERPLRVKMVVDVVKLIRKPEPAAN